MVVYFEGNQPRRIVICMKNGANIPAQFLKAHRRVLLLPLLLFFLCVIFSAPPAHAGDSKKQQKNLPPQETGFLNRSLMLHGVNYKYQVYLPAEWRRDDGKQWPIILFLHGRGERGSEGMWQTQIGLPMQVRDHPERWPFIIVMPQCPLNHFWTDTEALTVAMEALDRETAEFHADLDRTYLTGLSMGGYGAWELMRTLPNRWAAVAIAASGIFWSYEPERWKQQTTLPQEYARAIGKLPIWLFHGTDDTTVIPKQSELMFEAVKNDGGHIRLWEYQGLKHDCWTRAFNEPELPRWLLEHRGGKNPEPPRIAANERLLIPLHPPEVKLPAQLLDTYVGEYSEGRNEAPVIIYRQGDELFQKSPQGVVTALAAESQTTFYFQNSSQARIVFERDPEGKVNGFLYRDDRSEGRWELVKPPARTAN
jgi:predicted peptidase